MKKKRTKKPSSLGIGIKHISAVVKKAYHDIFFIGDSFNAPIAFNAHGINTHLRGVDCSTGLKVLIETLITQETGWFIFMVCYFETPNGQITVATGSQIIEKCNAVTMGNDSTLLFNHLIDNLIENNDDENITKENLISYGYMFGPHDKYDFDAMEENLIDRFFAIGIVEQSIKVVKPVEFDLEILLNAIRTSSVSKVSNTEVVTSFTKTEG